MWTGDAPGRAGLPEWGDGVCMAEVRRREHNLMIQRQCNNRNAQIQNVATEQAFTIIPPTEKANALLDWLKHAGESLRMFHFTLQLGWLRIEIVRASRNASNKRG